MRIPRFSPRGVGIGILTASAILPLAATLRADHQDFAIVSASASKAYTQRKFVDGVPQRETYVFFQGKTFEGDTRDSSIDQASFTSLLKVLAPDLARQNYYPADQAAADLLIVVNWGTTVVDPVTIAPSSDEGYRGSTMNMNSYLLGYHDALQREGNMDWATPGGMNAMEETHFAQLIDERYFVILLAYDYQKIRRDHEDYRRALREAAARHQPPPRPPPQPNPVWSVHMNMRAAGNNFAEALPAMSQAASAYFGRQEADLVDRPASVGSNARVDVGETKVLNVVK